MRSVVWLNITDQRYYNPWFGRFNSPDRLQASNAILIPANWNKYAYVGGDPINKTDPQGLCPPDDDPPCFSGVGTAPYPYDPFLGGSGASDDYG